MGEPVKLNLGCGDKKYPGYVNVDLYGEPDRRCDLRVFPWPFETDSVDEVFSEHFLEHVDDYEKTVLEMHRILKPGGVLHFKVPHFRSSYYPWHLHRQQFSTVTCQILCWQLPYQFGGRKLFDFRKLRLNYVFVPRILKWILTPLANILPSQWDYFGLPIDEIECWAVKTSQGATCTSFA